MSFLWFRVEFAPSSLSPFNRYRYWGLSCIPLPLTYSLCILSRIFCILHVPPFLLLSLANICCQNFQFQAICFPWLYLSLVSCCLLLSARKSLELHYGRTHCTTPIIFPRDSGKDQAFQEPTPQRKQCTIFGQYRFIVILFYPDFALSRICITCGSAF